MYRIGDGKVERKDITDSSMTKIRFKLKPITRDNLLEWTKNKVGSK